MKQITARFGLLAIAVSVLLGQQAQAALGQNIGVDIRALAMGNAVTADPPGVSAVHYNPAGLARLDGLQTDVQSLVVDFNIRTDFNAPAGFHVFGYSDDPVVCDDQPNDGEPLCSQFKQGVSKVESPVLWIPVAKKFIKWPKDLPLVAPLGGVSYRPPGSKFTFATAFYAPLVAGLGRPDDDPGNFMGRQVVIERFTYLSPSVAYQVTDNLALGASIGLSYQMIGLDTKLRFPNDLIGVLRLVDEEICAPFKQNPNIVTDLLLFGACNTKESLDPFKPLANMQVALEDTLSPTYNLGLLWEPNDTFGFGMVYQSKADMKLRGRYMLDNLPGAPDLINGLNSSVTGKILIALLGFPSFIPPKEEGIVTMNLEYPAHFQAGIKYKLFPELQFNVDIGWTDYAAWDSFTFQFDRNVSALGIAKLLDGGITSNSIAIPLKFKSPWNLGFGMQYDMTDRLRLRLGYEPRKSAIPDYRRNPLVPLNNTQLFGTGLTYRFDRDTELDLSAVFLRSRDNIPANTSGLANQTGVNNLLLNPYAGLDIRTHAKISVLGLAYRTRW